MSLPFYVPCGSLISPGDILDELPPVRLPNPIRIARKWAYNLSPKKYQVQGELNEVLEIDKDVSINDSRMRTAGEQVLVNTKTARVIFLTWGSEVEDDERSGKVHRKDWLIAPISQITADLHRQIVPATGRSVAKEILDNKSPHFFYLPNLPGEDSGEYYIDFRKICPVAAVHVRKIERKWRLANAALNDFYHQLIWFFTRQRIFFEPLQCATCGTEIDLRIIFQGQPVDPDPLD